MTMKLLTLCGILLSCLSGTLCQSRPPTLGEGVNRIYVSEDAKLGEELYRIYAFPKDTVTFGITGDMFNIGAESGVITLRRKVDYEQNRQIRVNITGNDGTFEVYRTVTMLINDTNDELPQFSQEHYNIKIPENMGAGTTVLRDISVTDRDSAETNGQEIRVVCRSDSTSKELDPCSYFRIQTAMSSPTTWDGQLVLEKEFKKASAFSFILQSTDGRNKGETRVKVTVQSMEKTPPTFIGSNTATVPENVPIGTSVMIFTATDGQSGSAGGIEYELVSNPGQYFALDTKTGRLTTVRNIDRELLFSTLITIQVAARVAGTSGQESRSVVQAAITVLDQNDNSPMFVVSPAIIYIKENIADQTPLPTSITIADRDTANNAQFVVKLLTHNDTFEVFPSVGRESLTVSIRVKDTSKIDYETGPRKYDLKIEAREGLTPERNFAEAYVTVNIKDVNDNKPQFAQPSYSASVSEMATAGTFVIQITATDKDSETYGQDGMRYKIIGNDASLFTVNRITGEITPKKCEPPGRGNCLDAEKKRVYDIIFLARDNYAEGFTTQVPLRITVLDENDNGPIFKIGEYESFIDEGEVTPVPAVVVEATDADSSRNGNNALTYSIIAGNPSGLWQIGLTSGVVTATRPVDFASTPGATGVYTMTVLAADPRYNTTGTVRINVRDKNNFTPRFVPSSFFEDSILEDALPGTAVLTVVAYDNDASISPNGQVRYRLISGTQDKFVMDEMTGEITVNRGALFDYDKQKRYEMRMIAADLGTPSLSASGTVVIRIRDANNKNPYFEPSSVRERIFENATVNTRLTQMRAKDPDSNAVLIYSFVPPYSARRSNGGLVDVTQYDYTDLFTIDANSGIVRTKRPLDRDMAAVITYTVRVRDTTGGPQQTAMATLIIDLIEVNNGPPTFPKPWTPQLPRLNISVQEELPPNDYVATIQATDPYDAVVNYKIISDPADFFNINPVTGVVTIKRLIDYEKTQSTFFVVTAADNGRPPLTSTATVNVNIININDNSPSFSQLEFNANLTENAPAGTSVFTVTAKDLDLGDYGVVRYSLKDPQNRFTIDPITGVVRVKAGADLDRETTSVITLNVEAYDSPNNPNDRKSTNVPIYITLLDTNDFQPKFDQSVYNTSVSENVPVQYSVIQVSASDKDSGANSQLTYYIIRGNPSRLFAISPTTGLITTAQPLEGRAGVYNLTVEARDGGTPSVQKSNAFVTINVLASNNLAPWWLWPIFDNQTINVLENQYLGLVISDKVKAKDDGEDEKGVITYGIYYKNQFVAETPNFRINPITGVISAREVYDREARDEYVVKLVARDNGNPPFESTRFVVIKVLDTDDHDPVFPTHRNCCVIPLTFDVQENLLRMQLVGQVNATDLDIGQNAETRYTIIGGNVGNAFLINATSGVVYTNKSLDHEVRGQYQLAVRASNINTKNRPNLDPLCACHDPSVILITVEVRNRNDFPPIFTNTLYHACVSYDAQISKSVTTIRADDPDSPLPNSVRYKLNSVFSRNQTYSAPASNGIFTIGVTNGSVHTGMLMQLYRDKYFTMTVHAQDRGSLSSNASLSIYVTDPAKEVRVTVREPPSQVLKGRLEEIVQWIRDVTGGIVCVNDVRVYREGDNIITGWTDVLLHVVDGLSLVVWDTERVMEALWPNGRGDGPVTGALAISNIEAANSFWSGFVIDPLLIAVILTLLFLLLLLLLLCYICFCMAARAKRRSLKSGFMIQPSGQINPLWKEKLYEDQELNMKLDTVDRAGNVLGQEATARLSLPNALITTRTETTTTEYAMNYEHSTTQQAVDGGTSISIGDLRIEAPLEGGSAYHPSAAAAVLNGGNSTRLNRNNAMADSATQVELMASRASLRDIDHPSGPSAIGARLHSYTLDGMQEVHSNDFNSSMNQMREEEYLTSWPRTGGTVNATMLSSHGNLVNDIHIDASERNYRASSQPNGLDRTDGHYQGEIILGSYHLPEFPNRQRQETRYRTESQQYLFDDNYH